MNSKHWSDEERAEFDALCTEAYSGGDSTRDRADAFRELLHDARQAHRFYAADVLAEAERRGLTSILNRWHKERSQVLVSYEGKVLSKPRVIGTTRPDADGQAYVTQAMIDVLSWDEIEVKIREYLGQVRAYKANIHTLVRLLELRDLAPAASNPTDAARLIGTTIDAWLADAAAGAA